MNPGVFSLARSAALLGLLAGPAAGQTVTFIEALYDGQTQGMNTIDGLDDAHAVVVSPDGAHVYVGAAEDDAVSAFSRDAVSGELTWIAAYFDEEEGSGIDGLDGVEAIAISPDGATLYAAGLLDGELAVFSRNAGSGELGFLEVHDDFGLAGVQSVVVSPDGENVYAAGRFDDSVVVYTRNTGNGRLTLLETETDGIDGVDGLLGVTSVAVSPDGEHLYAAGLEEQKIAIFDRGVDGALTFSDAVADGIGVGSEVDIDDKRVVRLDPSGSHLYVLNHVEDPGDVWVAVFSRNAPSGGLTFASSLGASDVDLCLFGIEGDSGIAFDPDGAAAYVNYPLDGGLVAFSRDGGSGALTFADGDCDDTIGEGVDTANGLFASQDLVASPDGEHLYVVASNLEDSIAGFTIACAANNLETLEGETIDDERTVQACLEITVGPNLFLDPGADVTLRTGGLVRFVNEVEVREGALLTVIDAPPN